MSATIAVYNKPQLTPPLKWAGGKRWLIPTLYPYWKQNSFRRLVEPFCGGLAVALGLEPEMALLNDVNPHLINFYRQLQVGLSIEQNFQNERDFYFQARDRFNALIAQGEEASKEAAEWFYYLNRTGFNGLSRFNQKGFFNVPFGRYKTINYAQDFQAYQASLSKWSFTCGDFETLQCGQNDFIYADPPYDVEFVSYSQGGFSWDDQTRLANWLAKQTCPVIVSNQATERIIDLYSEQGFRIEIVSAPRMISCSGDRTRANEMLAFKGI